MVGDGAQPLGTVGAALHLRVAADGDLAVAGECIVDGAPHVAVGAWCINPPHPGVGTKPAMLAARQPAAALVTMSAPVSMPPDPRLRILRFYARIRPFLPKPWWDESQRASRYPVTPTIALHELHEYLVEVRAGLPQITAPALLMHSRTDLTVLPDNMEQIYGGIGSTQKEVMWFEDAEHVMTEDPQHQQVVFECVADFLRRHVRVQA